jgi:hypothetical protein
VPRPNFRQLHADCIRTSGHHRELAQVLWTMLKDTEGSLISLPQRIELQTRRQKEDAAYATYLVARDRFFEICFQADSSRSTMGMA